METVKIGNAELVLQNGTMFRTQGESPYYCDLGITPNGNKVLFYYTDATEIVDYIQTIIDNIPEIAVNYLNNIINNNEAILVRCWYSPGSEMSCFEIYYDMDCESNDILEVIQWMAKNNDFAAVEYRFTQIKNGHQTICD